MTDEPIDDTYPALARFLAAVRDWRESVPADEEHLDLYLAYALHTFLTDSDVDLEPVLVREVKRATTPHTSHVDLVAALWAVHDSTRVARYRPHYQKYFLLTLDAWAPHALTIFVDCLR